ncbi:hypothetical protein JOC61_000082 [Marinitoga litoralis]|nr:hypothetical protein [Marinitoga litoralis]
MKRNYSVNKLNIFTLNIIRHHSRCGLRLTP